MMRPLCDSETLLREAYDGRAITHAEAVRLLALPEQSTEAALLRATATAITRKRFNNGGLLLGQIGVDMAPCSGDCAFCFFAQSHTPVQPSVLSPDEIVKRCEHFAQGGCQGVFLMTMHRFGFDWFRNLCAGLRQRIPARLEILANVGDIEASQLQELRHVGVTGAAYHVSRIREGIDSCMTPARRRKTIEKIIEAGFDWYTMCEPIGPEHTPQELADQLWLGVELPCTQHGAMQRFPVPNSPLYHHGQISLARLGQVAAVVALATRNSPKIKSIAVNVTNLAGLFSGANAFFPEAGEPEKRGAVQDQEGFTTALWRQSSEITTADCRALMQTAGFAHLLRTNGESAAPLSV